MTAKGGKSRDKRRGKSRSDECLEKERRDRKARDQEVLDEKGTQDWSLDSLVAEPLEGSDKKARDPPGKPRARDIADVGDCDTAVDLLVLCQACGVRRAVRTCEACWRLTCTPCGFDGTSCWACDWIKGEAYDAKVRIQSPSHPPER